MFMTIDDDCRQIMKRYGATYNVSIKAEDRRVYANIIDKTTGKLWLQTEGHDSERDAVHSGLRRVPTTPKPLSDVDALVMKNIADEGALKDAEIQRLKGELSQLQAQKSQPNKGGRSAA